MATIKANFGSGGRNLTPSGSSGTPSLALVLRDIADDLTELRTKFIATLTKLDADAGVSDINYVSTQSPTALKTIKG